MILEGFPVGYIGANCYIIGCEETKEAAVVDPGGNAKHILQRLDELGLNCRFIILTHGHMDHIADLGKVQEATGAEVMVHVNDADTITSAWGNLSSFLGRKAKFKPADHLLVDGDIIKMGNLAIEVIHTPGHTSGGISLKVGNNILTGDSLFAGSIGRTDFPGGSYRELIHSIKSRLLSFPDDTRVYPGHGPYSTIGEERRYNPFLR